MTNESGESPSGQSLGDAGRVSAAWIRPDPEQYARLEQAASLHLRELEQAHATIAAQQQEIARLMDEIELLRHDVRAAMGLAGNRWSEWGERAEGVQHALNGAVAKCGNSLALDRRVALVSATLERAATALDALALDADTRAEQERQSGWMHGQYVTTAKAYQLGAAAIRALKTTEER